MADLKVSVEKVVEVKRHPNADKLDIATVLGWNVIVGRDTVTEGSLGIFVPIDSIIPHELANEWGIANYLKRGNRVRTVKLRGVYSQGLFVTTDMINNTSAIPAGKMLTVGEDIKDILGITKYEPPKKGMPRGMRYRATMTPRRSTPYFPRYTNISHLQNYPYALNDDDYVVVHEKRHGTNFRFGWVKDVDRATIKVRVQRAWHRFKKRMGWKHNTVLAEGLKLHVGSHNVIRDQKLSDDNDIYWRAANRLQKTCAYFPSNYVFFCEISGPAVQSGFDYGCHGNDFIVECMDIFDAEKQKYLPNIMVEQICSMVGIPTVPELCHGPWGSVKQVINDFRDGTAVGAEHVREGVVIKPTTEKFEGRAGRVIFKYLSPEYLVSQGKKPREETEWH